MIMKRLLLIAILLALILFAISCGNDVEPTVETPAPPAVEPVVEQPAEPAPTPTIDVILNNYHTRYFDDAITQYT